MSMISAVGWLIVIAAAVIGTTLLVRRLFGKHEGSVVQDYKSNLQAAQELSDEIAKLRKESIRDTADFQEALKAHRAKWGSTRKPPADNS